MNLWRTLHNAVRTQLWPLPAAAVVLSVAAGVGLPIVDRRVDRQTQGWPEAVLFGGDAPAARTLLDAISSSLITVTSLTFSLTVVTLQLASSQFSPRLLRTFTRDRFVQVTLALFLATFAFSLTVMRSVRNGEEAGDQFVPRLSVTLAFLMALASVLGLVLFLAHLTREIRVETMLRNVHRDARATLRDVTSPADAAVRVHRDQYQRRPTDVPVPSASSGFLTGVDERALVKAACDAGAVVVVTALPGASLVHGVPLGHARFDPTTTPDADAISTLNAAITRAISTGFERTEPQDVAFGIRQLTDVATKALSPGINDPTTAVHALGHSSALLCELAHRQLGAVALHQDHVLRVVLCRPDFADLVDLAVGQPRRYGAADLEVASRLYALLHELTHHASAEQRLVVAEHLGRLREATSLQSFGEAERSVLTGLHDDVRAALGEL